MTNEEINFKGLIEAILFVAREPLPLNFFYKHVPLEKNDVKLLLDSLIDEYQQREGGFFIIEINGFYQVVTNQRYSDSLRNIFQIKKKEKLSKSAMEVLAIIAYKQPVHIAAIDELRGSSSRQHIGTLIKKRLVKSVERLEVPGRPMGYGTTNDFLKHFGLSSLKDLPKLHEIKEIDLDQLD